MSATKFISPLRVEADQKDVIIAHLKEELYSLKRNEQEFYNLEDQYRKLEHEYRLLADEKVKHYLFRLLEMLITEIGMRLLLELWHHFELNLTI